MLRTKTDVDRHVAEILRKVKSDREKNLKCYNIALLYYKVRDYESAKLYVSMYLMVKEDAPLANKLLGQIYEALGVKERALVAYKTSLEYEANQPELVLKICELMCETDVTLDIDRARYWCDRGSEFFPHDPAIFRLKERLLMMGGNGNSKAFEQLIQAELQARPLDVNVRIRLLKLYMETNRVEAAYNHAVELESRQTFRNELTWYMCFSQVCETYYEQNSAKVNWQFYLHWVSVLDRAARLTLMEGQGANPTSIADCVQSVFNLDQTLYKASRCSTSNDSAVVEFYKEFLKHMAAELYLHMATLTLKKAKKDQSNWKEASLCVAPLLFLAMYKPVDLEATWTLFLKANFKKFLQVYRDDAYYRVSQAGYVLLGLAKEAGNQFTEKVRMKTSGNWRERLFQRIFSTRDHRGAMSTSHLADLVKNPPSEELVIKLPVHNTPPLYTSELVPVFEKVHAKSLHYLVWLGVEVLRHNNYKLPPDFHTYSFTTLQVSVNKLGSVSVESLNRLDMDAFLYLTVFCTVAILDEEILNGYHSSDRPLTLPADISNMLCTLEQAKWWTIACGVYSQNFKNNSDFVDIRQVLHKGIEVLRIESNHGLDVQLIVKLARIFSERANQKQNENSIQDALEVRANMYWSAAIPLLEKIQHNQPIRSPDKCLFKCPKKELSSAEVASLLEEARYFVACQLMKEGENERAIEAFKILRSPHASFNQALIYKKLADAEYHARQPEDITSEIRSKHIILLTKARDCLYATKERIRLDKRNPLHVSLAELMEEIDSALVRIEPDFVHRRDDCVASDASISSVGSPVGEAPLTFPMNISRQNGRTPHGLNTSTPQRAHGHGDFRRQSNPAEYIEVGQLLQIQTLVDQNKKILEKIDTLFELLQQLTGRVDGLCEDVRKLKPPGPEDLYIFGEEEDYGEDVMGQYPTNFPAPYQPAATPHYYTPTRGVQGTSTLTYGAPPMAPAAPQFYSARVEPTLSYQPPVQTPLAVPPLSYYNQNALPFSEGQQLPDFLRTSVLPKQPVPPVNVVITTSDTLPTGPPPIQPPMSVTIPPQHRLGTIPVPIPVPAPVSAPAPAPAPVPISAPAPVPVSAALPTSTPVQTIPVPSTPPVHNFQISMPATANIPSLEKSPGLFPEEFESDDETNVAVERDPYPDFQPIIPLPDEVVVHTGEEGETVLFENRAKLYRHVDKEWKERGVGQLKILKNISTGTIRVLMRRDQVLKICANHLLKSDMELTPLKNSDCAYIWVANDFADETCQLEKLCAKFKTPDEALKFRDAFNEAKKSCGTSPVKPKKDSDKEEGKSEKQGTNKFGESGKLNFGGFTFSSTPTVKSQEKIKDTVEEKKKESQPASSPFASFSFTSPKSPSSSTTPSTATETPKFSGLLRQPLLSTPQTNSVTTPKPVSIEVTKIQPKSILKESVIQSETPVKTQPFIFTSSTSEKPQQKHVLFQDSKPETPLNKISESKSPSLRELLTSSDDTTSNLLDFAMLSKLTDNTVPAFTVGTDGKQQFEGAGSTVFARQKKNSEGEGGDDFVPTAEFKPVIPLPELIDVKTGEEGQEVLFEERSKLYRFDSNTKEWKERGVGKMKILKDPSTAAVRFLMRREQVLKLCCNHRISSKLDMKPHFGSDRAWTWHAQDYSESEMKNEFFALRFKNSDQAKAFKVVVDQVLEDLSNTSMQSPSSSVASPINIWKCPCLFPNSTDSSVCRACKKPKPRSDSTSPKLSEWMRPKPARWECSNCYDINEPKEQECVTCGAGRKSTPKSPQNVPLSEMSSLKPKTGSWNCQDCYLSNEPTVDVCSACESKKPSAPGEISNSPLSDLFKPKPGSWNCSTCYVSNVESATSCVSCQTAKMSSLKPKTGSWNCQDCYLSNEPTVDVCSACESKKPSAPGEISNSPLSDLFKPKPGSWNCSTCYVSNVESATSCVSCQTAKPETEKKSDSVKPPLSEMYKPKLGSWGCPECLILNDVTDQNCVACQSAKPGSKPKSKKSLKPSVADTSTLEITKSEVKSKSLAEMFKPKSGSWECSGCLVRNDADKTSCPACNTPKPGHQPSKDEGKSTGFSFGSSTFTFGIPASDSSTSGFNFDKPTIPVAFSTSENTGFSLGRSTEYTGFNVSKPTENTGFTFGKQSTEKKDGGFIFGIPSENKVEEKQLFNFGISQAEIQSTGFGLTPQDGANDKIQSGTSPFSFGVETGSLFGGLEKQKENATSFQFGAIGQANNENKKETGEQFSFGTPRKFEFTFGGVRGPRSPKSPIEQILESEPDEVEEDDGDHIHFQPVIPLPDKVDVKTGEEDEEVLYSHRSKLYRYTEGEWKERGIGDIKILRNFGTKKIRLLMRREPIMKLCLNHFLTADLKFSPKDNRAWHWTAIDYAEEQLKPEQFCLRFKTSEIATEFKEAIESAQKELETKDETVEADVSSTTTLSDEMSRTVEMSPETPAMKAFSFSLPTNTSSTTNSTFSVDTPLGVSSTVGKKSETPTMKAFSFNLSRTSSPSGSPFSLASQFGGSPAGTDTTPVFKSIFGGSPQVQIPQSEKGILPVSKSLFSAKTEAEKTDNDVEVVYENDVTLEEREAALKLQLPPKFYSYRRAPPCSGCIGCEPDDEKKRNLKKINIASSQVKKAVKVGAIIGVTGRLVGGTTMHTLFKLPVEKDGKRNGRKFRTTHDDDKVDSTNQSIKPPGVMYEVCSQPSPPPPGANVIVISKSSSESKPAINTTSATNELGSSLFGSPSSNTNQKSKFLFNTTTSMTGSEGTQHWFGNSLGSTNLVTHSAPNNSQSIFGSLSGSAITTTTGSPQSNSIFGGSRKVENENETQSFLFGGTLKSQVLPIGTPVTTSEMPKTQSMLDETVTSNETPKSQTVEMLVSTSETQEPQTLAVGTSIFSETPKSQAIPVGTPLTSTEIPKSQVLPIGTPIKSSEIPKSQSLFGGTPVTSSETLKTQSLFGGKPIMSSETPKTQSLFGGTPIMSNETPKTQSLFGGTPVMSSETPKTPSIFGGIPVSTEKSKSLFGGIPATDETPKQLVFGSSLGVSSTNTPKSQSFFGSSGFTTSENSSDGSKSIFGGITPSVKTESAIEPTKTPFSFGVTPNQSLLFGNIIGAVNNESNESVKPQHKYSSISENKSQYVFGGSVNNSEATKTQSGGTSSFTFGENTSLGSSLFSTTASLFTSKGETSFAQLAANKPIEFQPSKENVSWAGQKTPLFSKSVSTPTKPAGEAESSGDDAELEQSHDPHFDPIVPLPAAIQVRTGEEEETREFCHRAKLYRYNNAIKEWKERGVGEMKILRHPVNNTYRLLMRREQVHKVVCNHLLTDSIEMKMMPNSETSLTWGAMNLSDEIDTPQLELLAVRFKTIDLCLQFKAKVDECIQKVVEFKQASGAASPSGLYTTSAADSTVEDDIDEEEEEDDDYEGNDVDEYYDEEDEDEMYDLLFEKPVTLLTRVEEEGIWATIGSGDIQVVYDRDLDVYRILMKGNDGLQLFNSIISGDPQLTVEGKDCTWTAEEGAQVLARFDTYATAEEFILFFKDGVSYAEKALI